MRGSRRWAVRFAAPVLIVALAAVLYLSAPLSALADVASGTLSELPSPADCVGEEDGGGALCGTLVTEGLGGAYQPVVSPDGRNVYSVAITGALIEYSRNPANGSLSVIGCLTGVAPASCAPKNVFGGESVVDPSGRSRSAPDGKNVYVLDQDKQMVVELSRNAETGLLTVMEGSKGNPECITGESFLCETQLAPGLNLPYGIAVSPNGKSVYVASLGSEAVAEFTRHAATGRLEQIPGHECISGPSGSGCPDESAIGLKNAIGIAVSPGGEDVYVAAGAESETESDVAAFRRNEATGALEQLGGEEACIGKGVTGCAAATVFDGSEDLAISPDGKNIYVNSFNDDAVVELSRETEGPERGALGQLTGNNHCVTDELELDGCTEVDAPFAGPLGVAISPDGANVYVSSSGEAAEVAFSRNSEGALEPLPAESLCVTSGDSGCASGSDERPGLEGARRVTVSPDGTNVYVAGQSADAIAELARTVTPAVSNVQPSQGSDHGGTSVEIEGSGFADGARVDFGGVEAASVTVNSASSITAISPPDENETVQVSVSNAAGSSAAVPEDEFTFTSPPGPEVTGITPSEGTETGGTEVTISGSEFVSGATVSFGGSEATDVKVDSPSSITAISPPGVGTVDVTVTTGAGTSPKSSEDRFHYYPQNRIGGLDIAQYCEGLGYPGDGKGPVELVKGGVEGEDFAYENWACVRADGTHVLLASAGPAPSEDDACRVEYPGVASVAAPEDPNNAFSWNCFEVPAVSSVSPDEGPEAGGTAITIKGTDFIAGAKVTIGGEAASVVVVSATEITAKTAAHEAGEDEVVVTDADGTSTRGPQFTYLPPPTVVSVSPAEGSTAGGTAVTIKGTEFVPGAKVTIGGEAASVVVVSATEITAKTAAHAAGKDEVVVNDADGTSTGGPDFTFITPPTVTSISPREGSTGGGTPVKIKGTGFLKGAKVTIGSEAKEVVVVSETEITAKTAPGTAGEDEVIVTHGEISSSGGPDFTFITPPTVTSISPKEGSTAGGTLVKIKGTGFLKGAKVTIGSEATEVVVVSETEITAKTAAHTAGNTPVDITEGGVSQSATVEYKYEISPTVTKVEPAEGSTVGGTLVKIKGTGFVKGAKATIGNAAKEVVVVSETEITAKTAAHPPGENEVIVSDTDGTSTGGPDFTFITPPTVTSVSPKEGSTAGGTRRQNQRYRIPQRRQSHDRLRSHLKSSWSLKRKSPRRRARTRPAALRSISRRAV